jgi:hypothetical protein
MEDKAAEVLAPEAPTQEEMPFAVVQGAPFTEMPKDLYIPPHALEVILEAFEGPRSICCFISSSARTWTSSTSPSPRSRASTSSTWR